VGVTVKKKEPVEGARYFLVEYLLALGGGKPFACRTQVQAPTVDAAVAQVVRTEKQGLYKSEKAVMQVKAVYTSDSPIEKCQSRADWAQGAKING
jgi:hypothetical protein